MNDQDQLERVLGRELHDRADGLTGLPFGFDEVKGKAGRIRRNRRIAGSVAVAAAVGVIVPTVMAVSGSLQSQGEILPAPQPDAPAEVARTTLTLDGLERGADPDVEYFTPDGVVLPGEGLQELDRSYQALLASEADGGWVAVEPAGDELRYLTADFERQAGTAKNLSFEVMPDRSAYAFVAVEADEQTLVLRSTTDPEGVMTWNFRSEGIAEVVGFAGDGRVVLQVTDQTDGSNDLAVAEPDGTITDLPDVVRALSADPTTGLVAVQTQSLKDGSGCFGVIDVDQPNRPLWETCNFSLGSFSPDGEHLMASDSYASGEGPVSLSILDVETGDLVTSFRPTSETQVTLLGPTWESNDAIVAPTYSGEISTILRFRLDGTLEETVERLTEYQEDRYFYLGQDRQGM